MEAVFYGSFHNSFHRIFFFLRKKAVFHRSSEPSMDSAIHSLSVVNLAMEAKSMDFNEILAIY